MRRPEQIITKLSQQRQTVFDRVLARIESELEAKFSGNPIDIWFEESSLIEIDLPLRQHLWEYGWTLAIHNPVTDRNQTVTKITVGAISSGRDRSDEPNYEQQWER